MSIQDGDEGIFYGTTTALSQGPAEGLSGGRSGLGLKAAAGL